MRENQFQSKLIKRIKKELPGSMVLKNDPTYLQGVPDLIVLYGSKWGMLECKRSATASHQPNQDYYVDKLGAMSFASFICPENEKEVLDGLYKALGA